MKEASLYVVFGILTTIINIASYAVISPFMHYQLANIVAWILCVMFAFLVNKYFVFNKTSSIHLIKELLQFYSFRLVSLLCEIFLLYVFIDILAYSSLIAKIIINALVIIINYFYSKYKIFK